MRARSESQHRASALSTSVGRAALGILGSGAREVCEQAQGSPRRWKVQEPAVRQAIFQNQASCSWAGWRVTHHSRGQLGLKRKPVAGR